MSVADLRMTTVPITSKYGPRVLQSTGKVNFHKGTDHAFGKLMGISAYGDGIVTHAGWGTGPDAERGIWVGLEHAPGIDTSSHSLSRVTVKKGQRVKMGDIIGYGGKTAYAASGNHCHKGMWLNGKHVDETLYLKPGVVVTVSNTGIVSAVGAKPFPADAPAPALLNTKDDNMRLEWDTSGTGYLVGEKGWLGLPSIQVYQLFERVWYREQPDTFLKAEVDIMAHHQRLLDVQHATQITIDPAKLASAVGDELLKKGITVPLDTLEWTAETGELIAKQVAAAYETAVPRITKAILKAQGAALTAAG